MILCNAKIITQDSKRRIINDGYLVVSRDGLIKEIGEGRPKIRNRINLGGKVIIPGLINAHVHLGDIFYKKVAGGSVSPINILRLTNEMDSKIGLNKAKRAKYWFSFLTLINLIKNGVTTMAGGQGIKQAEKCGARFVGGLMIKGCEFIPSSINQLKKDCRNSRFCFPAVLVHSLLEVPPRQLMILGKISRKNSLPVMMHLGEFPEEEKLIIRKYKIGRLAILKQSGLLGKKIKLIVVHGGYIGEKEIRELSKYNIGFILCPLSSFGLGLGIVDIGLLNKYKIKSAIATDGFLTNPKMDLVNDVKAILSVQKDISPQILLDKLTIEAAEVLGVNDRVGSLEKNKFADFLILNLGGKSESLIDNLFCDLFSRGTPKILDSSVIGGKWIIKNRKIIGFSEKKIKQEVAKFLKKFEKKSSFRRFLLTLSLPKG